MSIDPVDPMFGFEESKTCRNDGALMAPFLPPFSPAHRQCPVCGLVEAFGWRWHAKVDLDPDNPWGIADESVAKELARRTEEKRQKYRERIEAQGLRAFVLTAALLLAGCRSFEYYPPCSEKIPCAGHEGQVYCYFKDGKEWVCCRCPK